MREFINLCKITKTVDSTKLIIGILIVVFYIVKTIMGDAKKERESKSAQQRPKHPKTVFPQFFDDEPVVTPTNTTPPPLYAQEGESVTSGMAESTSMPTAELDEAQIQAHNERWRQAVIDSEILKTKF